MGIGPEPAQLLRSLKLPKGFTVCELGSQIAHNGSRRDPDWKSWPARELYEAMGCSRYESIDANGEATCTADLNEPLGPYAMGDVFGQVFDLVTDWGTSEHCFNVAQAWKTIHDLCKPGGLIVFDKPASGYPGHGYFLFDKIFFYGLAKFNRYKTLRFEEVRTGRGSCWRGVFRTPPEYVPFAFPHQGKWRWKAGDG
jgi:hypothetical protein